MDIGRHKIRGTERESEREGERGRERERGGERDGRKQVSKSKFTCNLNVLHTKKKVTLCLIQEQESFAFFQYCIKFHTMESESNKVDVVLFVTSRCCSVKKYTSIKMFVFKHAHLTHDRERPYPT